MGVSNPDLALLFIPLCGRVMGPRRSGGTSNAKMVTCVISGRGQYTSRVPLARTAVCLILLLQYTYSIPLCLVYHLVAQGRQSIKIFCCKQENVNLDIIHRTWEKCFRQAMWNNTKFVNIMIWLLKSTFMFTSSLTLYPPWRC